MRSLLFIALLSPHFYCMSQPPATMHAAAEKFLQSLSAGQNAKAQFVFTDEERYNWHFVPKERKGISLGELNTAQRNAAMQLLRTALSEGGYNKVKGVLELEAILRSVENRSDDDEYRNPGKYYFSIFGKPGANTIWGWRLEGHHISFNFSSENNQLVAGTPAFLGANPAIVLSGPEKGRQILKDETELGFALLRSLNTEQMKQAITDNRAPADIITGASRNAIINDDRGVTYAQLNTEQQKLLLQLLSVYIHRYTKSFSSVMMKDIEDAGINKLKFVWAGSQQPGKGHYYRILGPSIIIEYDNTQNSANHVHTVLRDLKNDFGGDQLLEHYKNSKH